MNSNKDYVEPSPIQIRVFENKLEIINGGVLLEGWTVETLLSSHRSIPYNLDIANTFFRAGEIEAWGRGIERIITACKNDGFLKGHPVATRKEISESLSNITEDGVNTTFPSSRTWFAEACRRQETRILANYRIKKRDY